jgi:hypothetical protein
MRRILSLSLMAILVSSVGCGKKASPPPPVEPEPPSAVTTPSPLEKDKTVMPKDREPTVDPTKISPSGNGTLTRPQFRALVGKSKDDVLRRIGPADTIGRDGADEYWYYNDRSTNDDGTLDERAHVVMHNGIVKRVYFKPRD